MTSPTSPSAGMARQFPSWARELLRCPVDRGELDDSPAAELICRTCALAYPVIDGIPVLLVDDARRPAAAPATEQE